MWSKTICHEIKAEKGGEGCGLMAIKLARIKSKGEKCGAINTDSKSFMTN